MLPLKLILGRLQKIYSSEVYEDYESMCHLHLLFHAAFSLTTSSLVTNQGRLAMAVKATPKHGLKGLNGIQLLGFLLDR